MKTYFLFGWIVLILGMSIACQVAGERRIGLKVLPELVVSQKDGLGEGLSGAFGGVLKDAVLVAGGCNFPGIPAAQGGPKVYYDQIYVLRYPDSTAAYWSVLGRLPEKVAYGAAVTLPQGVVCIGGRNAMKPLRKVWIIKWDVSQTTVIVDTLPSLPVAMDNMTASTDGKNIYVAGGNVDGQPQNRCFILRGVTAKQWEDLGVFPGAARLQPVSGMVEGKFYLMGGFQPVNGEKECLLSDTRVCYDPEARRWEEKSLVGKDLFRPLVGAAAAVGENQTLIVAGGVHPGIFKTAVDNPVLQAKALKQGNNELLVRLKREQKTYMIHEPEWYQFNKQFLFYSVSSNEWKCMGVFKELARAGAVIVSYKDKWIVVNGESKPGIRSTGVYLLGWNE